MPAVGNDIVDLGEPQSLGKSGDRRFLERVFTADERERIASAKRPDALLWALWAAKEAAYKCVGRDDPSVVSIPRRYPVMLEEGGATGGEGTLSGRVATPRGDVALRIRVTDDYVHALAARSEVMLAKIIHRVGCLAEAGRVGGDSAFVRGLVIRELSGRLDCPAADLTVSPAGSGAPRVFRRGRPLALAISLSHDGRYAAFALDGVSLTRPVAFSPDQPPHRVIVGCDLPEDQQQDYR